MVSVQRFSQSFGLSVLLHVAVVVVVVLIMHYQPRAMRLPKPVMDLSHAIAVSLAPLRRPTPPKPVQKPVPHPTKPVPSPPVLQTQATQTTSYTAPPDEKLVTPQNPPEEPPQQRQATYAEIVESILENNKRYPRDAMIDGMEGDVTVSFIVNRQGTILAYTIEQSSGHFVLDDEIKRLMRVVRFPPFPASDTDERKTLVETFEFKLGG